MKIEVISFILFATITTIFSQQLKIVSLYPSFNEVINDTSDFKIKIIFDNKIDTIGLERKIYLFSDYTSSKKYIYKVEDTTLTITPDKPYFSGEKITVIITKSINGLNGENFSGFSWQFSFSLLNKNEPSFNLKKTYTNFNGEHLSFLNLNNDKYPDLILTDNYQKGAVILNKYGKDLMLWQELPTSPHGIIISDVDLDFKKEIHSNSFYFDLEQQENYYFFEDTSIHFGNQDMNFDAFPDFIIKKNINDTTQYISLRHNNGNGTYQEKEDTIVTDNNIVLFKVADFNNDGINDIIYLTNVFPTISGSSGENKIKILFLDQFLNIVNTYVLKEDALPDGYYFGYFRKLNITDFNNDSFLDIQLLTNIHDLIFINNKNGEFFNDVNHIIFTGGGDSPHNAITTDMDGDGWADLLYSYTIPPENFSKLYILFNPADSTITFWDKKFTIDQKEPALIKDIISADFNNDQKIDICALWDDGIKIYYYNTLERINESGIKKPEYFIIYQNYPNPFNKQTKIKIKINEPLFLESSIYNIEGKEIYSFKKDFYYPNTYDFIWKGINNNGNEVSSGVYIWRFQSKEYKNKIKLILIK
ncbi:FG-GAP-like repeat-containing protein [Calditrichota bacterium GD2]